MGCLFSGPLQKTSGNPLYANHTSFLSQANSSNFNPNSFNPNDNQEDSQEPIQKFYSFNEFIQQTDNPQIFEWLINDEIGKGAMSRVYLTTHSERQEKCAAKVYNKILLNRQTLGNEEKPIAAVEREIEIMKRLQHRYILPIVEVIEDDCTNSLIMILPFASEGTLQ